MSKKTLKIVLPFLAIFIIVLLALVLRSKLFIHGDFYYLIDQARDILLVKDIAINHNPTLIGARSGVGGIFHGPLWLYMLVPTFLLAHGDPFYTLVPVFLAIGLGTVVAGYYVGASLYSKTVGFIVGVLLAITPFLINATISTTNAQVMPLIFILYLYSVINFIRGKDKYLIVCALLIGFGIHFEAAFAIFLLPLILIAVFLRKKLPKVKFILIGIAAFFFTVANYLLFEVRNSFLMTNAILQVFQNKREVIKGYEQFSDIGFRFQDRLMHIKDSYFMFLPQHNILTFSIVSIVLLGALFFIIRYLVKTKKMNLLYKEYFFLLLLPVGYFLIFIFYPYPLWEHYLLPLVISSVFLFALSFDQLPLKRGKILILGVILAVFIFPTIEAIKNDYAFNTPYVPSPGTYKNQVQAAEYVYANAGKSPFGYLIYYPGILTYSMDYLMWWVGTEKYNMTPSNQKQQTTYLIMYPADSSDKEAHTFWKKNVIKTEGKVVARKEFHGGIVVEKLQINSKEDPVDPNYYQNLIFR